MTALSRPAPMAVLDWRSARSPRICRSALAAEASAGDEISDRSGYANMFMSELLFLQPAHRVGCRLNWVQATDAKSLFDAIIAENPNLTDKRTLVSIRAIQETTSPSWCFGTKESFFQSRFLRMIHQDARRPLQPCSEREAQFLIHLHQAICELEPCRYPMDLLSFMPLVAVSAVWPFALTFWHEGPES